MKLAVIITLKMFLTLKKSYSTNTARNGDNTIINLRQGKYIELELNEVDEKGTQDGRRNVQKTF